MNRTILATFLVAIASLNLVAEPSAFGAGNLDSPTPYGLTSSEKVVLQTKHALKKVVVKSNNQANEVDSIRERIDGLQSIVESLSRKSQKNKMLLAKLENKNTEDLKNSDEYEKRLAEAVEENTKLIAKNILLIKELGKSLNSISSSYVTKKEFNDLVRSVNEFKSLVSKELKASNKNKEVSLNNMTNVQVADKAEAFFNKKYYTKAIEYYSHLITNNYRPAYAHFVIGQMKFRRKNYSEAISYYKKSASLYSKASYMPELLLNTAISMDKTHDKTNAEIFYNAILSKYPNSDEAESAKEYLLAIK